ncbi:MAG: Na+/H+ antiporter NhaC family protein [Vicinamibacteria bacterium]
MADPHSELDREPLRFHGGAAGVVAPFLLFLAGVAWLSLSGAPDERGFWPVLLAALTLGLLLARDRTAYSDVVIEGMSQSIVMIMIMAWMLAGVLGVLMRGTGFVESLVWLAEGAHVSGGAYVAAAFLICCVVSTSTGTSIGTVLICGPLLYPPGGALEANPVMLMGAILGGATFGDNISPISDTTIASALTQKADIGGVVRSRLKYSLPALAIALILYAAFGGGGEGVEVSAAALIPSPRGLPMLLAPALVLGLLLAGRRLLEGLLLGILASALLGLGLGLLEPAQLLYIDAESFSAKGLILEGLERGIGASVFTLFLMGLVAAIQATGTLDRMVGFARERTRTARGAELWILGAVTAAVLVTAHSVVAMLTVGEFTRETGERFGIGAYRRANLLDVTVCSFPFLLPYFIPVILAASTSASGVELGMPRISPFLTGMANFYSWALLLIILFAITTGYGRKE